MKTNMLEPKVIQVNDKVFESVASKGVKEVELQISFPAAAEYFSGHFPEVPVLAGVVQVHFAVAYARQYFGVSHEVKSIKKLRFARIIQPEEVVRLKLTQAIDNPERIIFDYSCPNYKRSSGELFFGGPQ